MKSSVSGTVTGEMLSAFFGFAEESERAFPVDRWRIDGVCIWPMIRIWSMLSLHDSVSEALQLSRSSRFSLVFRGLIRRSSSLVRCVLAGVRDREGQDAEAPADVLFLSDGVSFLQTLEGMADKYCDPVRGALEAKGLSTGGITLGYGCSIPRRRPSKFVQHRLDFARLRAKLGVPRTFGDEPEGFEQWATYVRSLQLPYHVPVDWHEIRAKYHQLAAMADWMEKLLERRRVRLGVQVAYYSLEGLAFNLACHRMDISSVDIQHGYSGPLHPAYGSWTVPPTGYALLPSIVWTWSEYEVPVVEAWNSGGTRAHRGLPGGIPLYAVYDQWFSQDIEAARERISSKLDQSRVNVLVSGDLHLELIPIMKHAVDELGDGWCWWFRLHPTTLHLREEARAALRDCPNVILDEASELPLPVLFERMDLHLTTRSSTVMDAAFFGVPTVMCDPVGEAMYRSEFQGVPTPYAPPENVAESLISLAGKQRPSSRLEVNRSLMNGAVNELANVVAKTTKAPTQNEP